MRATAQRIAPKDSASPSQETFKYFSNQSSSSNNYCSRENSNFPNRPNVQKPDSLFRVTTPPLVRDYHLNYNSSIRNGQRDGHCKVAAACPSLDYKNDLFSSAAVSSSPRTPSQENSPIADNDAVELLSPSSLTACTDSTSRFSAPLDDFSLDDRKTKMNHNREGTFEMRMPTGIFIQNLQDASLFPPFKEQYTATGRTQRTRRDGPALGEKAFVNGKEIALFLYKKRVYAIENKCCHQQGPLFQGDIEDIVIPVQNYSNGKSRGAQLSKMAKNDGLVHNICVICPWHNWRFDLNTGKCLHEEERYQEVYRTTILRGGEIAIFFKNFDSSIFDSNGENF